MKKWARANYMPNKPLYDGKMNVTAGREHLEFSKKAAGEGMVLLKNEHGILPFQNGQKVAVFGKAIFDYVKGGGGSGDVSVAYVHNIYDGFSMLDKTIRMYEPLISYYKANVKKQYLNGALPGLTIEPELPQELLTGASSYTDTAMIVISRFSGEGWDRKSVYYEGQEPSEEYQSRISGSIFGESDYYLTSEEGAMIEKVKTHFKNIIVVLNVGGVIDSTWISDDDAIGAALLAWQPGMEGGLAVAELLMGIETPSGKLPDSFARSLEAYPSTEGFHASHNYVEYTEDIYVGYRYFETIEGKDRQVNYPFGYGLSYTSFSIDPVMQSVRDHKVYLAVMVKNEGSFSGKEVLQIYVSAPQGKLGKASRSLVAFEKTKKLAPGEEQILTFEIPFYTFASYDDLGKVEKSAYILEEGTYDFYVGNSVKADNRMISFRLDKTEILEQLSEKCSPVELSSRLRADASMEDIPQKMYEDIEENILGEAEAWMDGVAPILRGRGRVYTKSKDPSHIDLIDVYEKRADIEEFMEQLSNLELADLLGGQPNQGVANTYGFGNNPVYGIPNIMTTDGPAGVRILPEYEIYSTAWPCASLLASSWNKELMYKIGVMAAEEVKENNLSVWLAPAVNIHRSPLCGRNFEYYSEDPLLTGEMAASLILGVQSLGIAATVKHFACNNKETNRRNSDSRVSERALREIYLKQFEIIIKKSSPWLVMSSYNLINGRRASENKELLEGILREEWNYDGVVTSDWYTMGEHYKELLAGNDIKMGTGYPERLMKALEQGVITREDMKHSVRRILKLILKAD